jgi:hypothetical protein
MTEQESTTGEPEQTDAPKRGRRLQPPALPSPSDEGGEDAAAKRTSPFPYAERFGEWVSDETAVPGGRQHRRVTGDTDR